MIRKSFHPASGEVALANAAWQGYPDWRENDDRVAYTSTTLVTPEDPPFPGVAVAVPVPPPIAVTVEVWMTDTPSELRQLFATTFAVSNQGVVVGDLLDGHEFRLQVSAGIYPLSIWVDASMRSAVRRVVFVLSAERRPQRL